MVASMRQTYLQARLNLILQARQAAQITQFSHQGKEGYINANGSIDMTNGVGWHINADMKILMPAILCQVCQAKSPAPSIPMAIGGQALSTFISPI